MNTMFSKPSLFRFLILLSLSLTAPSTVLSEEEHSVSADTYKALQQADTWLKQGKVKQAVQKLRTLQTTVGHKPFETAVTQQYLAYALAEAGRHQEAARAAKSALDSKQLTTDAAHGLIYLVGQIALRQEHYRDCVFYLEQWLQQETQPHPEIDYMAGYAAYRAHLPTAAKHLERAIAAQKSPPESWLSLLLAIYSEHKQYPQAEALVKKLIAGAAKRRQWWLYLSRLYLQQDHLDQALATLMLAYYNGAVNSDDILQLIRLNAHQSYPAKAARLLTAELDGNRLPRSYENLKLLFNCWQLAREWDQSRQVLTEAVTARPNGEDFAMLGRLEMQQQNWSTAEQHFRKALRNGNLRRRQRVRLWLGIAAAEAGHQRLAQQTLQALLDNPAHKREAAFWLKRLDDFKNTAPGQRAHSNQ